MWEVRNRADGQTMRLGGTLSRVLTKLDLRIYRIEAARTLAVDKAGRQYVITDLSKPRR